MQKQSHTRSVRYTECPTRQEDDPAKHCGRCEGIDLAQQRQEDARGKTG